MGVVVAVTIAHGLKLAAIATCAALMLLQTVRLQAERTAHANTRAAWAAERAASAAASARAQQRITTLQEDHHAAVQKITDDAAHAIAAAQRDAARAGAAADSLQRDIADYIDRHRAAALARAAAGQCTPDAGALDLLADLRRSADDRAGALAAIADDARARGNACQRQYDSAVQLMTAARQAAATP